MHAKRLTLCLVLLGVLLLQLSVAQKPKEAQPEQQMATTVASHEPEPLPASAAGPDDPPAVVATPQPTELAPESVPESSADPIAAAEPAVESVPAPTAAPQAEAEPAPQAEAEPAPQAAATPAPAPAAEATSAPEFLGETPFVPSSDEAESTQPDEAPQNDEPPSHVDETPKMPETEKPAPVPEETHSAREPETPNPNPAEGNTSSLSCFSCSSGQKGACSSNPREKITCPKNSKGCFTLIKRDTKLVTRGCQSELTEEGATYCHKEPKLCEMCADMLCNRQVVPPIAAATRISLGWTMLCCFVFGLLLLV